MVRVGRTGVVGLVAVLIVACADDPGDGSIDRDAFAAMAADVDPVDCSGPAATEAVAPAPLDGSGITTVFIDDGAFFPAVATIDPRGASGEFSLRLLGASIDPVPADEVAPIDYRVAEGTVALTDPGAVRSQLISESLLTSLTVDTATVVDMSVAELEAFVLQWPRVLHHFDGIGETAAESVERLLLPNALTREPLPYVRSTSVEIDGSCVVWRAEAWLDPQRAPDVPEQQLEELLPVLTGSYERGVLAEDARADVVIETHVDGGTGRILRAVEYSVVQFDRSEDRRTTILTPERSDLG